MKKQSNNTHTERLTLRISKDLLNKIQEQAGAQKMSVSSYVRACLIKEIIDPIIEKVRILKKYNLSDADICKQTGLSKEEFYLYMKIYPKFFMAARNFNVPEQVKQAKAEGGLYRGVRNLVCGVLQEPREESETYHNNTDNIAEYKNKKDGADGEN